MKAINAGLFILFASLNSANGFASTCGSNSCSNFEGTWTGAGQVIVIQSAPSSATLNDQDVSITCSAGNVKLGVNDMTRDLSQEWITIGSTKYYQQGGQCEKQVVPSVPALSILQPSPVTLGTTPQTVILTAQSGKFGDSCSSANSGLTFTVIPDSTTATVTVSPNAALGSTTIICKGSSANTTVATVPVEIKAAPPPTTTTPSTSVQLTFTISPETLIIAGNDPVPFSLTAQNATIASCESDAPAGKIIFNYDSTPISGKVLSGTPAGIYKIECKPTSSPSVSPTSDVRILKIETCLSPSSWDKNTMKCIPAPPPVADLNLKTDKTLYFENDTYVVSASPGLIKIDSCISSNTEVTDKPVVDADGKSARGTIKPGSAGAASAIANVSCVNKDDSTKSGDVAIFVAPTPFNSLKPEYQKYLSGGDFTLTAEGGKLKYCVSHNEDVALTAEINKSGLTATGKLKGSLSSGAYAQITCFNDSGEKKSANVLISSTAGLSNNAQMIKPGSEYFLKPISGTTFDKCTTETASSSLTSDPVKQTDGTMKGTISPNAKVNSFATISCTRSSDPSNTKDLYDILVDSGTNATATANYGSGFVEFPIKVASEDKGMLGYYFIIVNYVSTINKEDTGVLLYDSSTKGWIKIKISDLSTIRLPLSENAPLSEKTIKISLPDVTNYIGSPVYAGYGVNFSNMWKFGAGKDITYVIKSLQYVK